MKVLIACEESQAITIEMRKLWIEAYSCDIQECSWGHPEWHIKSDVLLVLNWWKFNTQDWNEIYVDKWDMMIGHPTCTYLSNAWARHLFPGKILNQERYEKGLEAKEFFMKLYNAPIDKIVLENPTPSKIYWLPQYTQVIQPYQFWHPVTKRTCLWIKWLPNLQPTNIVEVEHLWYFQNWPKKWKPIDWVSFNHWSKDRSKTFHWIATAIAEQWWLLNNLKKST